jgi:hypothetical protein
MIAPRLHTLLRIRQLRCVVLCAAVSGSVVPRLSAAPTRRLELVDEVVALEQAVNALARPASDPRKVLRDVRMNLRASSHEFIETDIAAFVRRMPDPRTGVKCSAAFLRDRARKELLRVKDVLLDANPQTAHPEFCSADPAAIDAAKPARSIDVYGYDFDREPIQVLLMNDHGFLDATFAARLRSHYHLIIDLEAPGLKLSPMNRRIAISVGHLIRFSIPLIQSDTKLCTSRLEQIDAGKSISYAPPAIARGEELRAGPARFWVNASLGSDSNAVEATVCMTAVASSRARPGVSGCAVEYVYTTDADRTIERVLDDREAAMQSEHTVETRQSRRGSGPPVTEWEIAPAGGDASSTPPSVTVRFGAIRVISTDAGDCVAPSAFAEAKRTGHLGADAVRRLDPQLRAVDDEIRNASPER